MNGFAAAAKRTPSGILREREAHWRLPLCANYEISDLRNASATAWVRVSDWSLRIAFAT